MAYDVEPYLDYRVRWRNDTSGPGRHAMCQGGSDGEFRAYRPFWQLPDARHIDVRRSALDPLGEVIVRQTGQRSSINLVMAVDLSRSMTPAPDRSGLAWVSALADSAARSALRAGDGFAVVGFDQGLRNDVWLPPTRSRAAADEMVARLASLQRGGTGAQGMLLLGEILPARRCLVLLVSDFLMPLALIDRAMSGLAAHDVAPVVLEIDSARKLPRHGLLRLADAESGRTRLMLMRPGLHRRLCDAETARRRDLDGLFLRFGRAAFYADGSLDVQRLSLHLLGA